MSASLADQLESFITVPESLEMTPELESSGGQMPNVVGVFLGKYEGSPEELFCLNMLSELRLMLTNMQKRFDQNRVGSILLAIQKLQRELEMSERLIRVLWSHPSQNCTDVVDIRGEMLVVGRQCGLADLSGASAADKLMFSGGILLLAVAIDAISRSGAGQSR